jgi:hypothetical protein
VIYDKIKKLNPFGVELLHRKDFFESTCLELDLEMFQSRTVPGDSVNLFIVYFKKIILLTTEQGVTKFFAKILYTGGLVYLR